MKELLPKTHTNIVSPKQFIFWSIASFGLFDCIRSYRNRTHFKEIEGSNIMPFWRAFFTPLRMGELFKKIKNHSAETGIESNFEPVGRGVAYIALSVIGNSDRTGLLGAVIGALGFRPILTPLKVLNQYYKKIEDNVLLRPLLRWHYILIVFYVAIWALFIWAIIDGILNPEINP